MSRTERPQSTGNGTSLRAGALTFPAVLMQAVTHIGPAVATLLSLQYITTLAGNAAPLVFLITSGILLALGVTIGQLARRFPSAGGYYTYVSRTLHPRAGWLTAWLYFLYDPIGTAVNLAFMGYFFQAIMKAEYGFTFQWWWFFLIALAVVTVPVYRGVAISARLMVGLGLVEVSVIVALAVSGLVSPGSGGVNADGFLPSSAPSSSGLYLGVVFSIFLFTGFESVAPLAEETRNPRRLLPRAIWMSLAITGLLFVFSDWAILIGHGTTDIATFESATDNPVIALAKHLWGFGWLLILLAMVNSILGVAIACTNSATRVFYSMGRSGALPRQFADIHPRYRTPRNAIVFQTLITLAVGIGIGSAIGPANEFYMMGITITLGLIMVYIAGNLGVIRVNWREHRSEFNVFLHFLFPVLTTGALVFVAYKSIVPYPAYPGNIAPVIVAVWLAIGIALIVYLQRTGREDWMAKAAQVYEGEGIPDRAPAAAVGAAPGPQPSAVQPTTASDLGS